MLDGLDLTRTRAETGHDGHDAEDAARRAELGRLRLALQNSDLNRPRHRELVDRPDASTSTSSPENGKGEQPKKRRVQWLGLEDDSRELCPIGSCFQS